jgi:ubiquinone biosynthesis monooxygenase Coq7
MHTRRLPLNFSDALLTAADTALRTLFAPPRATRPTPSAQPPATAAAGEAQTPAPELSAEEKRLSAALMRVNHVGEVCAQALYTAQALSTPDPALRRHFMRACDEETDHLAWTKQRLDELGSRTSLLNPLWYAGAFAIGLAAGRMGNAISLGFVVETERQVEAHLDSHLERLPAGDQASRAIVAQMSVDEAGHASEALAAGGVELPGPVKGLMRAAAKVMTATAHYI